MLLCDSYEPELVIKFCLNKILIKNTLIWLFFLIMLFWLSVNSERVFLRLHWKSLSGFSYNFYMKVMSVITKIILTWLKDWKKWFWKLQANISNEIWSYIDSDIKEQALCSESICSEISDLDSQAISYINLSAANQKLFENTQQFFDQDVKYYSH